MSVEVLRLAALPGPSMISAFPNGVFMKTTVIPLAGLFLAAGALANSPDSSFYKNAAEGGMSEVELGQLAQQKASSASVKEFGSMMVKDHSAANEKLKALAASKQVSRPGRPEPHAEGFESETGHDVGRELRQVVRQRDDR